MSRVVLLACLAVVPTTTLRAQQDLLQQRLDPATYAALRPLLDSARRDSLPLQALEAKALEGAAKRRPHEQIVATLRRFVAELREARHLLRQAAPRGELADGEVVAVAEARRHGAPADDIVALRRSAPVQRSLEIPIALLGELIRRQIPSDEARQVIEHLIVTEVPQERMVEILPRVDVALRVGAPPVAALGTALQSLGIPAPPVTPGRSRPNRLPSPTL